MPPTDNRDNSHQLDDGNHRENRRKKKKPLREDAGLILARHISRLLTVRVVGFVAIAALTTIVLAIVTVTGLTQKRTGSEPRSAVVNEANKGTGTTSSNALNPESRDVSAPSQTPQIMRGPHTTQTVVPIDMNKDLRTLPHIPSRPRSELPEFRRHGDGREEEEKETNPLSSADETQVVR